MLYGRANVYRDLLCVLQLFAKLAVYLLVLAAPFAQLVREIAQAPTIVTASVKTLRGAAMLELV